METKGGKSVQTGQRMFAILSCLKGGSIGLRALAQRVDLPPSTTHRLLLTLMEGRLVEQNTDSTYRLGIGLVELGFAALAQHDLRNEALPEMKRLSDETHLAVNLAQLDGTDIIYLENVSDKAQFVLNVTSGARHPAYCRALGKVLLAGLGEEELRERLSDPLPKLTANTIATVPELIEHLRGVRAHGYALDLEEAQIGCVCVAAPIKDVRGHVIAAVSVSGTTPELQSRPMEDWIGRVKATALAISRKLGYAGA